MIDSLREEANFCNSLEGFPARGAWDGIAATGKLLAGISGGVDSMVLLHLLFPVYRERLIVCHINHGLRGRDADLDQELVESVARKMGLECLIQKGDVEGYARAKGISIELAAREFRYQWFNEWAKKTGAGVLFLAHHADDQAETVLFNLCRGGGGLKGMSAASVTGGGLILSRPLLGCLRRDIQEYACSQGIKWREDHTNSLPVAVRNKLRLQVVPLLEEIMHRPVTARIAKAAELEKERSEALSWLLESMELTDPQGRLYLPKVVPVPPSLRRAIIHWYLVRNKVSGISSEMVDEVERILEPSGPAKYNLPGGGCVRRKEKRLIIQ